MIKVVALDPGITTGISLATITDSSFRISSDQFKLSHRELWNMLFDISPDYLICESFEYRSRARDNLELYSCELIGVVHLFNSMTATKLCMQTAAQGKGHYNDTKLKKLELYIPGVQHGRDSTRHLMQWFTFNEGFQFNKKQKPILARMETLLREIH